MKLLLVHQYFKTPNEGGGIRSYHLARGFQEAGIEVEILSRHNEKKGKHSFDGLTVHYLPVGYDNGFSFVKRIISFLSFVWKARTFLRSHNDFELAYVMSVPLTTGLIARRLKKRYGIPYVFEVGDLWPEVPVKLGIIRNPVLKKWLYRFEKKVYLGADKLVALSPPIAKYMEEVTGKRVPIETITNFSDNEFFVPKSNSNKVLKIGYSGAISFANHLEYLVEVARLCKKEELPVEFHIMGFGKRLKALKALSEDLTNVFWKESGGTEQVRTFLQEMDASYISFQSEPALWTGSPNKLFDGLAAGHLIITNFGGWVGELIEKHGCGFSYSADNPEVFVEKIQSLLEQPEKLREHQINARQLAEGSFDKNKQLKNLAEFLFEK